MDMNSDLSPFLREHYKGADGLREILKSTKSFTDQIPGKLRGMQTRYLEQNPSLYTPNQRQLMGYCLEAYLYKEFSSDWLAEQIWSIVHTGSGDRPLTEVLWNSFDAHDTADVDTAALSLLLDNFLVQSAAFIDFYLLYLWMFFRQEPLDKGFVKWPKVEKMLRSTEEPPFDDKARKILAYLQEKVFSGQISWNVCSVGNWGAVVSALRHKVVHRDRALPSLDQGKSLTSIMIRDWADELKSIGCARFCEDVRGDMFYMVSTLAGVLYDEEWKPGL